MLGMGWFPATLGGLNRYYRALFEELAGARGVVIGPADDAPRDVAVVASADKALARRVRSFLAATTRAKPEAELVDAHFALYAAAPLLLGRLRGIPTVFHFQGPWADENVVAGDSSAVKHLLRARLERSVHARIDAHVVLSSAFRRVLVERYRVRPWQVHVLAPGVALEQFTPGDRASARGRLGLAPGAFVAVCTRRLTPRMGIEVLLEAWGRLADELPDGSVLLLVGDGALRGAVEQRAARAPLAGRVRVLGRISDEQLIDSYRAADVAVVPTVALEGYGLVVLEAAACGTPSVVSDVGGLAEAALELDGSLVVEPGDSGALAGRLRAAAAGQLPGRERTRQFAEEHSWRAVADRHRALYRALLQRRHDERVKVVYLDHVARLSGGEIALMRLLPRMREVNAHVILGEDGPLADRLVKAGVSVEVMAIAASARDLRRDQVRPGGGSLASAWSTAVYVLKLARRLRKLAPDVVHTNSLKAGVYGSIAARLAGIPVVWHVRDRVAEDYIPAAAVRMVRILVGRLAAAVIANSDATLATLKGAAPEDSFVIPASVELSPLARRPTPQPTFGMLGRIAPWKGQDLFLKAFAEAFADGHERAVLIGSALFGEEDYERRLHDLVDELGLDGRVEFRGFREDVWPELASLDVLVHASVIPEPFGTVVLEGMAAGLPVIAPDEGGPAAVIRDGETGRLFPTGDQHALARLMRELRDDPREGERLARAGRDSLSAYRPETVARRLESVYDRVLARDDALDPRGDGDPDAPSAGSPDPPGAGGADL
jgi:glycosyltransferase involved in cell wall biosynthesis